MWFFTWFTRFYTMSEVQIHAWFRPTATCGSQRCYKYNHAWVAKVVLVHVWVVLITTGVLYQWCGVSTQSLLHARVLATTSTSTKNTLVIVIWDTLCCTTVCVAMSVQWLMGLNQPCTGEVVDVDHLGQCMATNVWFKPLYCKWCAWL